MVYDVMVIGKGLMGAAATRYLAKAGARVAVLGPDEPEGDGGDRYIFASHYDQGRITRVLDREMIWGQLAQRAIGNYRQIEQESGIPFYFPVGGLYVSPAHAVEGYAAQAPAVGDALGASYERLSAEALSERFPFLAFPSGQLHLYEPDPAGYINPRDLVRAQLQAARQQGAEVLVVTAARLARRSGVVEVMDVEGRLYRAEKMLLATGAFSKCYDLLPQKIAMRAKTTTIVLARVAREEVRRLHGMPTLIYDIEDPVVSNIYLLPPILYPDGAYYLKMGCNTAADRLMDDCDAIRRWFLSGESEAVLPAMKRALESIIPGLEADQWHTRRCVTARTPSQLPYIDQLGEGIYLCAGGNGSAAKSSDTLGFLGAQLVLDRPWPDPYSPSRFRIRFA